MISVLAFCLAVWFNESSIGLNKKTLYLCALLILTFAGNIALLLLLRSGPSMEQIIIYHREIDFAFKQLRLYMGYHNIIFLIASQLFWLIGCGLFLFITIYQKVIMAEGDKYFTILSLIVAIPAIYGNTLIVFLYHGNSALIIIKFYKINRYLRDIMKLSKRNMKKSSTILKSNSRQTLLFSPRSVNVTFPLIIDVHFKLCEIFKLMISQIAFSFVYNKHAFIIVSSIFTYCYVHNVVFKSEIYLCLLKAADNLIITIVCTILQKMVSTER